MSDSEKPIDFELIKNAKFPEGPLGVQMIEGMNRGHASLTDWGFRHVSFGPAILDVGCGGGIALQKLAARFPEAKLWGCDVSPLAIASAKEANAAQTAAGRMQFLECGVSRLPFPDHFFSTIFSVESLYFWPNPEQGLREILRVLQPGGCFMTALEMVGGTMSARHAAIARQLEMFCPTPDELRALLERVGFTACQIEHDLAHGWLCGVGKK